MKLMIASDIHGSYYYCKKLIEAFESEEADKLILLGDLLYHGPRNDLPKEYAPKEVIPLLNGIKEKILCVRGNCDSEVDQMVLEFPIMAEYAVIMNEKQMIYATHGHNFNENRMPPLQYGDILMNGHTHVPKFTKHETYVYMNPGSVSIPKEGSSNSYMIMQEGTFVWKSLESGEEFLRFPE
jgi:putative phosphoesterase